LNKTLISKTQWETKTLNRTYCIPFLTNLEDEIIFKGVGFVRSKIYIKKLIIERVSKFIGVDHFLHELYIEKHSLKNEFELSLNRDFTFLCLIISNFIISNEELFF
jgi:hypothetical protein